MAPTPATVKTSVPKSAPIPADMPAAMSSGAFAEAHAAIEGLAPLPRARPDPSPTALALLEPEDHDLNRAPASAPITAMPPQPSAEDIACLSRLPTLGVVYKTLPPMNPGESCNVDMPLEVSSIGSGVSIAPKLILSCRVAEGLALWMKNSVIPAASADLSAIPNKLPNAQSYVCRTRYNNPGEKVSEHAHANAIDVVAIGFADRPPFEIKARDGDSPEARFQSTIRGQSCTYFTTSLGPGSNEAHATHFHLDEERRHSSYRVCDLGEPQAVTAAAPVKN
jgi:hypothetical protein